jgi:hypothetical protein
VTVPVSIIGVVSFDHSAYGTRPGPVKFDCSEGNM